MRHFLRKAASCAAFLSLLTSTAPVFAMASPISISAASPSSATVGVPAAISASVSAPSGIKGCNLYVDNDDKGAMTVSGGIASLSYIFPASQIYTVFVFCHDNASNFSSGPDAAVWAKTNGNSGGGDAVAPTVGTLSPTSVVAGTPATLSVSVSDNIGVTGCNLFVSGVDQGAMMIVSGAASKMYTFNSAGMYSAYTRCVDAAANQGTGNTVAVDVSAPTAPAPIPAPTPIVTTSTASTSSTSPATEYPAGSVIKLECPTNVQPNDPCTAVYYIGKDGKRHAFPNDKVFFSWYQGFDGVESVSADVLSSFPLGANVTYRPGVRMVKFTTDPKVYAVSKGGVLRWVPDEVAASAIYGANWNTKIDDLSDAFFTNYHFGTDISSTDRFSVTAEMNGALTIDDTL